MLEKKLDLPLAKRDYLILAELRGKEVANYMKVIQKGKIGLIPSFMCHEPQKTIL
ncbi:hypothetical protein [Paenibacillus sp. Leaf72]|uniref:hypothetical protein n=1 Tax=Paenibacillus sp. Leaf72 TaxID=1736234 RepID=UPI000AB5C203|nr:hypothetical protein [Paenibacillus sp. Leaf72]